MAITEPLKLGMKKAPKIPPPTLSHVCCVTVSQLLLPSVQKWCRKVRSDTPWLFRLRSHDIADTSSRLFRTTWRVWTWTCSLWTQPKGVKTTVTFIDLDSQTCVFICFKSCQLQRFSTFYRANYYCIRVGDDNQTENKTRTTGEIFQETFQFHLSSLIITFRSQ